MPDLIRHPVPAWIPAFAGMTTLMYLVAGVIIVADMSFFDSYELMVKSGCSKIWDPDRVVVREVWKGVIDERI